MSSSEDNYSYLQDEALKSLEETTKRLLVENKISFDSLLTLDKADLKDELKLSVGEVSLLLKFAKKHSSSSPTENPDVEEEAQNKMGSSNSVENKQYSHTDPNSCDFNNNNDSSNNYNAASAAAASPQTPSSNFSSWLKNSGLAPDLQQLLFNKGISSFSDLVEISKKSGGLSELVDENFGFQTQLEMFLEKEQEQQQAQNLPTAVASSTETETAVTPVVNNNVALNNVQTAGSILLGNYRDCKIDASVKHFTIMSNNQPIPKYLKEETGLSSSVKQALANRGITTEEKFAGILYHYNLDVLKLELADKLELETVVDGYYSALAQEEEILESCKQALRNGNEERYKQRLIGGRTISRKETFQQLRIYSNANKNNNKQNETPSSPASPSSPTKTYDETNEGAVINGQDLPSVAMKGSNLVVVNGVAGTGKTYLCEMLAIEQNVPNALVINVPLRDLAAENVKVESVSDLLEFSVGDMLDEKQQQTIARGKIPLIFLLDGFDEVQWSAPTSNIGKFLHHFVHPSQRAKNAQNPKFKNLVRTCDVVVVTSREERTRNDNVDLDDPNAKIDHWNLMLWNNDQVLSYSKKWFKLMREDVRFDVDKAAVDVVNSLRAEYMQHFFGLPLFVNLLCELRLDNSSSLESLSPSKLFEDLIELFWKRSKERIAKRLLTIAADYKLSKNSEADDELLSKLMKEAALAGFKQLVQTVIEDFTAISFDLNSLPNKKPPLFAVLFESAGLLRFVSKSKARFPHRSYIEFLCAKYASENPATALIVPPVVDESLPKEKQEKVPETILWTQKFATVWLILADFARRNEAEYQQEKQRTTFFSSVNYSKIHIETFIKHLAQVHFNKNKENFQSFDINKGSEIVCTLPLLRLTMILRSSCDQLLDAIKSTHGLFGFTIRNPRHFLWLAELSGKVGAIQALEWVEKNYKNDVTPDLLKLALGHALDRQELPAVANFVGALTKPPRNIPVSLEHAVKAGSVVGTTIAASKKENNFDANKWSRYLKLVFERQQYDVAAVLLMNGDWKNDGNKNLLQCLSFSLPKFVSIEKLSPEVLFTLVVSSLSSTVQLWNSEKNKFDQLTRSSVAMEKCGVKHLDSEDDPLLFFLASSHTLPPIQTLDETLCQSSSWSSLCLCTLCSKKLTSCDSSFPRKCLSWYDKVLPRVEKLLDNISNNNNNSRTENKNESCSARETDLDATTIEQCTRVVTILSFLHRVFLATAPTDVWGGQASESTFRMDQLLYFVIGRVKKIVLYSQRLEKEQQQQQQQRLNLCSWSTHCVVECVNFLTAALYLTPLSFGRLVENPVLLQTFTTELRSWALDTNCFHIVENPQFYLSRKPTRPSAVTSSTSSSISAAGSNQETAAAAQQQQQALPMWTLSEDLALSVVRFRVGYMRTLCSLHIEEELKYFLTTVGISKSEANNPNVQEQYLKRFTALLAECVLNTWSAPPEVPRLNTADAVSLLTVKALVSLAKSKNATGTERELGLTSLTQSRIQALFSHRVIADEGARGQLCQITDDVIELVRELESNSSNSSSSSNITTDLKGVRLPILHNILLQLLTNMLRALNTEVTSARGESFASVLGLTCSVAESMRMCESITCTAFLETQGVAALCRCIQILCDYVKEEAGEQNELVATIRTTLSGPLNLLKMCAMSPLCLQMSQGDAVQITDLVVHSLCEKDILEVVTNLISRFHDVPVSSGTSSSFSSVVGENQPTSSSSATLYAIWQAMTRLSRVGTPHERIWIKLCNCIMEALSHHPDGPGRESVLQRLCCIDNSEINIRRQRQVLSVAVASPHTPSSYMRTPGGFPFAFVNVLIHLVGQNWTQIESVEARRTFVDLFLAFTSTSYRNLFSAWDASVSWDWVIRHILLLDENCLEFALDLISVCIPHQQNLSSKKSASAASASAATQNNSDAKSFVTSTVYLPEFHVAIINYLYECATSTSSATSSSPSTTVSGNLGLQQQQQDNNTNSQQQQQQGLSDSERKIAITTLKQVLYRTFQLALSSPEVRWLLVSSNTSLMPTLFTIICNTSATKLEFDSNFAEDIGNSLFTTATSTTTSSTSSQKQQQQEKQETSSSSYDIFKPNSNTASCQSLAISLGGLLLSEHAPAKSIRALLRLVRNEQIPTIYELAETEHTLGFSSCSTNNNNNNNSAAAAASGNSFAETPTSSSSPNKNEESSSLDVAKRCMLIATLLKTAIDFGDGSSSRPALLPKSSFLFQSRSPHTFLRLQLAPMKQTILFGDRPVPFWFSLRFCLAYHSLERASILATIRHRKLNARISLFVEPVSAAGKISESKMSLYDDAADLKIGFVAQYGDNKTIRQVSLGVFRSLSWFHAICAFSSERIRVFMKGEIVLDVSGIQLPNFFEQQSDVIFGTRSSEQDSMLLNKPCVPFCGQLQHLLLGLSFFEPRHARMIYLLKGSDAIFAGRGTPKATSSSTNNNLEAPAPDEELLRSIVVCLDASRNYGQQLLPRFSRHEVSRLPIPPVTTWSWTESVPFSFVAADGVIVRSCQRPIATLISLLDSFVRGVAAPMIRSAVWPAVTSSSSSTSQQNPAVFSSFPSSPATTSKLKRRSSTVDSELISSAFASPTTTSGQLSGFSGSSTHQDGEVIRASALISVLDFIISAFCVSEVRSNVVSNVDCVNEVGAVISSAITHACETSPQFREGKTSSSIPSRLGALLRILYGRSQVRPEVLVRLTSMWLTPSVWGKAKSNVVSLVLKEISTLPMTQLAHLSGEPPQEAFWLVSNWMMSVLSVCGAVEFPSASSENENGNKNDDDDNKNENENEQKIETDAANCRSSLYRFIATTFSSNGCSSIDASVIHHILTDINNWCDLKFKSEMDNVARSTTNKTIPLRALSLLPATVGNTFVVSSSSSLNNKNNENNNNKIQFAPLENWTWNTVREFIVSVTKILTNLDGKGEEALWKNILSATGLIALRLTVYEELRHEAMLLVFAFICYSGEFKKMFDISSTETSSSSSSKVGEISLEPIHQYFSSFVFDSDLCYAFLCSIRSHFASPRLATTTNEANNTATTNNNQNSSSSSSLIAFARKPQTPLQPLRGHERHLSTMLLRLSISSQFLARITFVFLSTWIDEDSSMHRANALSQLPTDVLFRAFLSALGDQQQNNSKNNNNADEYSDIDELVECFARIMSNVTLRSASGISIDSRLFELGNALGTKTDNLFECLAHMVVDLRSMLNTPVADTSTLHRARRVLAYVDFMLLGQKGESASSSSKNDDDFVEVTDSVSSTSPTQQATASEKRIRLVVLCLGLVAAFPAIVELNLAAPSDTNPLGSCESQVLSIILRLLKYLLEETSRGVENASFGSDALSSFARICSDLSNRLSSEGNSETANNNNNNNLFNNPFRRQQKGPTPAQQLQAKFCLASLDLISRFRMQVTGKEVAKACDNATSVLRNFIGQDTFGVTAEAAVDSMLSFETDFTVIDDAHERRAVETSRRAMALQQFESSATNSEEDAIEVLRGYSKIVPDSFLFKKQCSELLEQLWNVACVKFWSGFSIAGDFCPNSSNNNNVAVYQHHLLNPGMSVVTNFTNINNINSPQQQQQVVRKNNANSSFTVTNTTTAATNSTMNSNISPTFADSNSNQATTVSSSMIGGLLLEQSASTLPHQISPSAELTLHHLAVKTQSITEIQKDIPAIGGPPTTQLGYPSLHSNNRSTTTFTRLPSRTSYLHAAKESKISAAAAAASAGSPTTTIDNASSNFSIASTSASHQQHQTSRFQDLQHFQQQTLQQQLRQQEETKVDSWLTVEIPFLMRCRSAAITLTTHQVLIELDQENKSYNLPISPDSLDYLPTPPALISIPLHSIKILNTARRFRMRYTAVVFENDDLTEAMICFKSIQDHDHFVTVFRQIRNHQRKNHDQCKIVTQATHAEKTKIRDSWVNGKLSNFQYLLELNHLAHRTVLDFSQYPVFPWVVSDYSSKRLDLENPETFRRLDLPMGLQGDIEKQEQELTTRFHDLEDICDIPFHYFTHYSTVAVVLFYLIRYEPFTAGHVVLHEGRFDQADRMFHSIKTSWQGASTSPQDVKELIPEFFSSPEFLRNQNNIPFGARQNGERMNSVALPPWAENSPWLFVAKMREALESEFVTGRLHYWIDLIFGYKQRGPAAVGACNLFHPDTYEGDTVTDDTNDVNDEARKQVIDTLDNTGQCPVLIFRQPHQAHKMRNFVRKSPLGISTEVKTKEIIVPYNNTIQQTPPVFISVFVLEKHIVLFDTSSAPYVYELEQRFIEKTRNEGGNFFDALRSSSNSCDVKHLSEIDGNTAIHNSVHFVGGAVTSVLPPIVASELLYVGREADKAVSLSSTLVRRSDREVVPLAVSRPNTVAVLATADEKQIYAVVPDDKSCVLVGLRSRYRTRLTHHTEPISCMHVSSDNTWLVTGSLDCMCCVYSVEELTGTTRDGIVQISCSCVIQSHCAPITSVFVSSTLDTIISGDSCGVVQFHTLRRNNNNNNQQNKSAPFRQFCVPSPSLVSSLQNSNNTSSSQSNITGVASGAITHRSDVLSVLLLEKAYLPSVLIVLAHSPSTIYQMSLNGTLIKQQDLGLDCRFAHWCQTCDPRYFLVAVTSSFGFGNLSTYEQVGSVVQTRSTTDLSLIQNLLPSVLGSKEMSTSSNSNNTMLAVASHPTNPQVSVAVCSNGKMLLVGTEKARE